MMVKMGIVKMMVMMKMVVRLFFLKINSTNCFCHNDLGPQGDNEKGVGRGLVVVLVVVVLGVGGAYNQNRCRLLLP